MNYQHRSLAAGRWKQFSFIEQMANIGSEVERALNWQAKSKGVYCQHAFERALELLDLALENAESFSCRKELARLREALVDYFFAGNQFESSGLLWRKYFSPFIYAARRDH